MTVTLYQNLKRIFSLNRAALESALKPNMFGVDLETGSLGAMKPTEEVLWFLNETEIDLRIAGADFVSAILAGTGITVDSTDINNPIVSTSIPPYPYDLVQDPSGFVDPEILCYYDYVTRKVTLYDNGAHIVKALWQGEVVPELVDGWESEAHDPVVTLTEYYLYYRDGTFYWSTTPWHFSDIMICSSYTGGDAVFALRECHGLMQWQTHEEAHDNVSTYTKSGGGVDNYVLTSTVATDRRPTLNEITIKDEDLPSKLAALLTNEYTWGYLMGTGVTTATQDNAEIISVDVSGRPFYNEFVGGNWVQTIMANNEYAKIFVMSIPVTDDPESSKARFLFVQPQAVSTSLLVIQETAPVDVVIGDIQGANNEFVYTAEIIVRATSNNWYLESVKTISGGRYNQTASPSTPPSSHDSLAGLLLAGVGIVWGHINNLAQSIAGLKTFINGAKSGLNATNTLALGGTAFQTYDSIYEEGSFTFSLKIDGSATGITTSFINGYYTKIGKSVTCYLAFLLTSKGVNTGSFTINDLHYPVKDVMPDTLLDFSGVMGYYGGFTGVNGPIGVATGGGDTIELWFGSDHNDANTKVTDAQLTDNTTARITIQYVTT